MRTLLFTLLLLGCAGCGVRTVEARPDASRTERKDTCESGWSAPPLPSHPADSVRAVFLELTDSFAADSAMLKRFFDTYRMDAVVVHSLKGYRSLGDRHPRNSMAAAATLLRRAPAGVKIFVGLGYDAKFYATDETTARLDAAVRQDSSAAAEFWRLADTSQYRIAGWYISREFHNFRSADPRQRERIRAYLDTLIRKLPGRPQVRVLISPFFVPPVPRRNRDLLPPDSTGALFAYLVRGTGVTDVLLQDGTGERNKADRKLHCEWKLDPYLGVAAAYARAVSRSLPAGVTFWSNLEGFGEDAARPADAHGRFAKQLATVPADRRLIMFSSKNCDAVGYCSRAR